MNKDNAMNKDEIYSSFRLFFAERVKCNPCLKNNFISWQEAWYTYMDDLLKDCQITMRDYFTCEPPQMKRYIIINLNNQKTLDVGGKWYYKPTDFESHEPMRFEHLNEAIDHAGKILEGTPCVVDEDNDKIVYAGCTDTSGCFIIVGDNNIDEVIERINNNSWNNSINGWDNSINTKENQNG